jgi:arylsulfatase A-like enzyme
MTGAADNAVVFLHNQAASPSSPPSHGSIQTGMIPRVHGVVGDRARLDDGTPMISTQLGAAGIATAYYGNNPFGMGRLEKPGEWTAFHQPNKEGKGIDCTVLMDEMLRFAREQHEAGKRFFISSLPYEPHTPYRYHEGISEKYHDGSWGPPVGKSVDGYLLNDIVNGSKTLNESQWAQLRALYDGEVEHMDECFGQFVDGLEKAGLGDDTAIVLTSDHGEGMFEHGRMGHAFGHYSELANVPLVIYADGLISDGPRKVETVTNHIDIAPTVLDLMGVEPSDRVQGESVLPIALRQGPWTPRVVSLEYGKSYALRSKRWKIIVEYDGTESLYDLQTDPTEQKDLVEENDFALRYLRDLAGFFLEHRKRWRAADWGTIGNHGAGFIAAVERDSE